MSVFARYAQYYDSLYRDKDYAVEAKYVIDLIESRAVHAKKVLDVGCGTGRHAVLMAQAGFHVYGVDRSAEMLEIASGRKVSTESGNGGSLKFSCCDIVSMQLGQLFDVAVSLFHVMNYLTAPGAFLNALRTIRSHLEPGGLFIFDTWFGPAVVNEAPETRVRRIEVGDTRIIRIAEPEHSKDQQRVDVNYQLLVLKGEDGSYEEFSECHEMKYLFADEIEHSLANAGFDRVEIEEWMTGAPPDANSWSVTVIAQAA
jgi:SAM-dependent methyltransferase